MLEHQKKLNYSSNKARSVCKVSSLLTSIKPFALCPRFFSGLSHPNPFACVHFVVSSCFAVNNDGPDEKGPAGFFREGFCAYPAPADSKEFIFWRSPQMKKTLAAAAVLGAFAGSALAADVTLYGVVDLGLQYTHSDPDTAAGRQAADGFRF